MDEEQSLCGMMLETFFDTIFLGISLTAFVYRFLIKNKSQILLEYESWCNIVETGYYLLITIIGFINTCSQATQSYLKNFFKFFLFKFIFPPILACPIIFFLGENLGWFIYNAEEKKEKVWRFLCHFGAPACFLLDCILFKRKIISSNLLYILIIVGIYVAYSILCLPFISNEDYVFVNNGKGVSICVIIVFYCIAILMHFLYMAIAEIRNCGKDD